MRSVVFNILLFCVLVSVAQPPARFYTKFGGNGDDIGYSAKQTLDGHYIIAGSTTSYGNGNTDIYFVKLDSLGQFIWTKTLGGYNNDVGKSVIQLSDSGYVVAGFTNSFGAGGYDAYIVRTDKKGDLIWQRTFGGLDWDFANDLVLAADGNIVVVGNTNSFGAGKKDGFVIKYDLSGNLLWQKFFGGAENEELRAIIKTNDNFLATVGYTESKNDPDGDGYFLKLDLNGDTLFTRVFGDTAKDYANDLVQNRTNDYIIAGAMTFSNSSHTQSLMYALSANGNFSWKRILQRSDADECFQSVANSRMIGKVSAFIRNVDFPIFKRQGQFFSAFYGDGFEYQINESGGYEDEYEYSIEETRDGGYVEVGSTLSFGSIGKDVYFIKRDSAAVSYSSIVSIQEVKNDKSYVSYRNQFMVLNLQGRKADSIEIFDLNGKLIDTFTVTDDHTEIDTSKYTGSIYIVRIKFKDGQFYHDKFISK